MTANSMTEHNSARIFRVLVSIVCSVLIGSGIGTDLSAEDPGNSEVSPLQKAEASQEALAELINEELLDSYLFIGGGSGVIISREGEFLTNYHVVKQIFQSEEPPSRVIEVERRGGESLKALIISVDPVGDLAYGRILEESSSFSALGFGDSSELHPGQYVLAVGNPFLKGRLAAEPTVTFGTISALNVTKPSYGDSIQTDAPINPGNSGGPLVNLDGELVGINGRIETKFGTRSSSGAGFAITIDQIKRFLPVLRKGGLVFHAKPPDKMKLQRKMLKGKGVKVLKVIEGSPAYRAGIREGDVLLQIDDREIETWVRFYGIVQSIPANQDIQLTLRRDGEKKTLSFELGQVGSWSNDQLIKALPLTKKSGYLGVVLQEKTEEIGIQKIIEGSPADRNDLSEGDVIRSINGRSVPTKKAAIRMIQSRWSGQPLTVEVIRGSSVKTEEIVLGKRSDYEATSESW